MTREEKFAQVAHEVALLIIGKSRAYLMSLNILMNTYKKKDQRRN